MILDDDPDIEIDWDGSGRRPVLRVRLGNAMHIVLMKHNKAHGTETPEQPARPTASLPANRSPPSM